MAIRRHIMVVTLHSVCISVSDVPPAFTAQAYADAECIEDQPIYFNRSLIDVGNNYDETESTFVSPVDGLYLFILRYAK